MQWRLPVKAIKNLYELALASFEMFWFGVSGIR